MFQQRRNFGGFFPVSVKTCKAKLYLAFIMHILSSLRLLFTSSRLRLKCDGTRAETSFRLSAKRTSPFKSAEASVQSTTGRRAVHISLQGLYCSCKPVFCCHVTLTGYPLHSLVFPSLSQPCFTVCHHISTGLYRWIGHLKLFTYHHLPHKSFCILKVLKHEVTDKILNLLTCRSHASAPCVLTHVINISRRRQT
jgi:hypothetical protein